MERVEPALAGEELTEGGREWRDVAGLNGLPRGQLRSPLVPRKASRSPSDSRRAPGLGRPASGTPPRSSLVPVLQAGTQYSRSSRDIEHWPTAPMRADDCSPDNLVPQSCAIDGVLEFDSN